MIVEQFPAGGDRNFAYIIADPKWKVAAVVDPASIPEQLNEYLADWRLELHYIFNTHRHQDHTAGNEKLRRYTGRYAVAQGDVEEITQVKLQHGARLPLGEFEIEVLHTPGHTPDSICLYAEGALFTGDTLFVGKIGGTSGEADAKTQYESLHERLMVLPEETIVYPGHDVGVAPTSTLGNEKKSNPFLLQPDFASFYHLKQTWVEYKKQHGIA